MKESIINPYGEEATITTDGKYYRIIGRDADYISQFMEGVIAAFTEDVTEDGEVVTSHRDYKNYKSHYSEDLTKKNDGKKCLIITISSDYLT